uniref:Glutaredoxin domain-containing protein n=1 Tax=Globodera rostochiensis TaxID=31243 RepID=A0A914GWK9_GLORO
MSSSRLLFPLALLAANSFLVFAKCDEASKAAELTARSRRSAKCYNDVDIAKYRNGLSSMFSFQNALREPSVGPRHVRQQPAKMDGFSASTGAAAGAGGSGNVYWMSSDPNSPDLQAWTGVNGAAPAAGAPQSMGASASGGAVASSPSVNTYGIQQQQSLSAQQPPSQQPQQQSMAMALPQQQQQVQQQQPISMMPMQYQQGGAYGYGQQGYGTGGGGGYGSSAGQMPMSPYSSYLEKQISTYPVMIYTLSECLPCQNAKRFLAVHYPDVRAHYLELSGNEPWQQQLQIDLQYLTGAITFPYIFVCGQYIGGASELFELHESGQLRRMVSQCLKPTTPK